MILFIPMLSVAKIIFDHVESLKPYGYLIGNRSKESPSLQIKNWFKKKLAKKINSKLLSWIKIKRAGVAEMFFTKVYEKQSY